MPRRLIPSTFLLAHEPLELIELPFNPLQQRRQALLVVGQGRQHLVVVHGQQRVDEGLLAFLLVVAPHDLRPERDLAEEGEGEEDADDPAVDDERGDRVEGRVGGQD
jgi:hypothetical protein